MINCEACKKEINMLQEGVYKTKEHELGEVTMIICPHCNKEYPSAIRNKKTDKIIAEINGIVDQIRTLAKARKNFTDKQFKQQYDRLVQKRNSLQKNLLENNKKLIERMSTVDVKRG